MAVNAGKVIVTAVMVAAAIFAVVTLYVLRKLRHGVQLKAEVQCTVPPDKACTKDSDCILVRCVDDPCACMQDACYVGVNRRVLERQEHPCLLAKGSMTPPICRPVHAPSCECAASQCAGETRCVAGQCTDEQLIGPGVSPDAGP